MKACPFHSLIALMLLGLLGPAPAQAQWRQLGGLVSADVVSVVEGADGVLLAAHRNGQSYRSEDGGESWQPGPRFTQPRGDAPNAFKPDFVGFWYDAATASFWAAQTSELYRSTDNGISWQWAGSFETPGFCRSIDGAGCTGRPEIRALLPRPDGTLLIAHEAGITLLDPATAANDADGVPYFWNEPERNEGLPERIRCSGGPLDEPNIDAYADGNGPDLDDTVRDLIADETGQVFAATRDGVFRWETDGTWTRLPLRKTDQYGEDLPVLDTGIGGLAIRPARFGLPPRLFAGIRGNTCADTTRAGEADVYALSGSVLTSVTSGFVPLFALAFNDEGTLYAATPAGLFVEREFESGTFLVNVPGLPDVRYNALLRNSQGRLFAGAAGAGGIYRRLPGGAWNNVGGGLAQNRINFLTTGRDQEIVATQAEGVFRSTDNGTTWTDITPPDAAGSPQGIVIDTTRNYILLPYDRGWILRSRNGGNTWPDILNGLLGLEQMFIMPGGDLYARAALAITGLPTGIDEVYRSRDGGSTWMRYTLPGTRLNGLRWLESRADGALFMATQEGVFRSTDQGETWTGYPEVPFGTVSDFALLPDTEDFYARISGSVVYFWNDADQAWTEVPLPPFDMPQFGPLVPTGGGDVYFSILGQGRGQSARDVGILRHQAPHGTGDWTLVSTNETNLATSLQVTPGGDLLAGTLDFGLFILENPDPPHLRFPAKDQISIPANPVFGWDAGANAGPAPTYRFQLTTQAAFETDGFANPLVDTLDLNTPQFTPNGLTLDPGQRYCWQVEVETGFISNRAEPQCFGLYPAQFDLALERTFGDPTRAASFQLLSLPGQVNLPIGPLMQGKHDEDWRAYLETGAEGDAHAVAYRSGDDRFTFRPGRAFWVLGKNPITLARETVDTVTLSEDEARVFSIPLHTGWNLIGNPFEIAVPWAAVLAANPGADPALWRFRTGWVPATELEPYEGYYYFNASGAEALHLPYTRTVPADAPQFQTGAGHAAPEVALIPTTVTLSAPYPNPFQTEVHLAYQTHSEDRVTLEVYDVLGRRVHVLTDAVQPPGRYELTWDGTDGLGRRVAPGLYLFRLTAGRRTQVRKAVYRN